MSDQIQLTKEYSPGYGHLTSINNCRLILNTVGDATLKEIANNYLGLLESSGAIYEANGDYALGIFSSGWCQFLDSASRKLCNTDDNVSALNSGKWICHECCWNEASLESIKTKKPVDIECKGGIRLYAVPILSKGEAVGSMNFGYGDPPTDPEKLQEISKFYQVDFDELTRLSNEYIPRLPQIIIAAKSQLVTSAKLIGQIIERKHTEAALQKAHDELEIRVGKRTIGLAKANEALRVEIAERKQAEEALRESQEKYHKLFSTSTDGIMVIDAETAMILDVNEACEKIYGYSRGEFQNLCLTDISAEPDLSLKAITPTLKGELKKIHVRYHKKKDRTILPIEVYLV